MQLSVLVLENLDILNVAVYISFMCNVSRKDRDFMVIEKQFILIMDCSAFNKQWNTIDIYLSIGRTEDWLIFTSFNKLHFVFVNFIKFSVNRTVTTPYTNAAVLFIFIFLFCWRASFFLMITTYDNNCQNPVYDMIDINVAKL